MTNKYKRDFPIFGHYPELVYLDNAATSQKPQAVLSAIRDFYERHNSNVHRGIYDLSEEATALYEGSREKLAEFINADSDEVIFSSGTTDSANLIARSALPTVEQDSVIITSVAEHHSNFLPFLELAQQTGAKIELVGISADNARIDLAELKELLQKHKSDVKAVVLSAISNVTGRKLDLEIVRGLIRDITPEALYIVDAAQLAGHAKIDVKEIDCDFLFFSGHKMFAETGIGVLYGRSELLERMQPVNFGGGIVSEVDRGKFSTISHPQKFEAGTPHISGAISMAAAVDYIESIGIELIENYERLLVGRALSLLKSVAGISIVGGKEMDIDKMGIVSFSLDTETGTAIHAHDIAEFLNNHNIAVRAGQHCTQILHNEILGITNTVRASLHLYNDFTDIEALVAQLPPAIDFYNKS